MLVDLHNFMAENEAELAAASEFRRRAEMGVPTDRFGSGNEMVQAAKGIWALEQIRDILLADALERSQQEYQSGLEAMEPSSDPMRG